MAATQKTLTPTNEVISIPAFTDKPDYRLPIDSTGKLADAINELDSKITPQYVNTSTLTGLKTELIAINGALQNNTDTAIFFALASNEDVFGAYVIYTGTLHRQDANNFSCNVSSKLGQNVVIGYSNGSTWVIDSPSDNIEYKSGDSYDMTGRLQCSKANSGGTSIPIIIDLPLGVKSGMNISHTLTVSACRKYDGTNVSDASVASVTRLDWKHLQINVSGTFTGHNIYFVQLSGSVSFS